MDAGAPVQVATGASPPPAPANVASPKKVTSPKVTSPKKATPPKKVVEPSDKTDTESAPSTPAAEGAKENNKEKKPRNRNKKPQQPKTEGAAASTTTTTEEGNAEPSEAAQKKPKNKGRANKPQQQGKKENHTASEPKAAEDGAGAAQDENKNKKPRNKNKNNKPNAEQNEPSSEKKNVGGGDKPKVRTVKGKNTEVFVPMNKPVDLRITFDLGSARDRFSTSLTSRDVLLAPNVFSDFKPGELYAKLLGELTACGIPEERLLKMWHGNEKIDGTHLIADDKTRWKANCPTFHLVIDRLAEFFRLKVQATRFNWYKDTSQWKPFHFDAAAVKPEIAAKQNFTVGVSFGATRDAAFEHAKTRTVVSVPQPDGCVYAFSRDTNVIWRHGILQDAPVRQEGRISVIAWGWIDGMVDAPESVPVAPVTEQTKLQHKKNPV